MKYFTNCTTVAEVKTLYKDLAKKYHPDLHQENQEEFTRLMQEINREYDFATRKLLNGENLNAEEFEASILEVEAYRNALNKVLTLEGITIEIVGSWIWVGGNTKPYSNILKDPAGGKYTWAKKKGRYDLWFFHTDDYKTRGKSNKDFEEIKKKYGTTTVPGKAGSNRIQFKG